ESPDLPSYRVTIGFARAADGRRVPTQLYIEAEEITVRGLRRVPLGAILPAAQLLKPMGLVLNGGGRGPDGWPAEHFERVASFYRGAQKSNPRAPIRTLVEQLGVSESTVRRWLRQCRQMGLLGAKPP